MSDMDDLISGDDIDEMMNEISDDPTAIAPFSIPLTEKTRPSLKTPILSGKQMAGQKKKSLREPVGTQRLFAAKRDDDSTIELPATQEFTDPAKMGAMSVDEIYNRAGLEGDDSEAFTVYKVESMLADESIAELDDPAKEAAVVMALKTHNVPMASVIEDAKDRAMALDEHDARFKDELSTFEEKIRNENERLHAEIERYANPRLERMEKNETELEGLRRTYRDWFLKKEQEQKHLENMIKRWSDESLQIDTVRLAAEIEQAKAASLQPTAPMNQISEPPPAPIDYGFADAVTIDPAPTIPPTAPIDLRTEPTHEVRLDSLISDDDAFTFDGSATLPPAQSANTDSIVIDDVKPKSRFPRTPLQWLVTILAIGLWILGGFFIASELQQIQALAALGMAFVVPIVVAVMMSILTRGRGFAMGMVAWLAYSSLAMIVFAHVSADRLASALLEDEYWIVAEAPIFPEPVGSALDSAAKWYGGQLVANGIASPPQPAEETPESPQ